ncbi:MAG: zonula occludens toxin, partial [Campylobacter sp.]
SGQSSSQKSFVRKFFYIALFVFIALSIYFYFFIKSLTSDVSDDDQSNNKTQISQPIRAAEPRPAHQPNPTPQIQDQTQTLQTYIYNLSCIDEVCTFKNEKYSFPYGYISFTVSSHKPLYFYSTTKGKHLTEYFLIFDVPALEELKNTSSQYQNPNKGVSYENSQTTSLNVNSFK